MKRAFAAVVFLLLCSIMSIAQKGKAEADYYPLGYPGDTWTEEVTAFDNERRTLTLTNAKDKLTFIATIPDAPYEWRRNGRNERVLPSLSLRVLTRSVRGLPLDKLARRKHALPRFS